MFKSMKFIGVFLLIAVRCFPQYQMTTTTGSNTISGVAAEYQYNSGKNLSRNDLGLRYDGFQNKGNWNLAVSYDFGNTKSKGSKESGISLSGGYNYGFSYGGHGNLYAGGRLTLEFDSWKDDGGKTVAKETVLIPKVQAGYLYLFDNAGHWYGSPELGYGYGFNIGSTNTEKKPDEGGRVIPGIYMGYRF